jgi:hypothetical protein
VVKSIGEGWHANWLPAERLLLIETDADYWKTWTHARLTTPPGKAGALTLFKAQPVEHLSLAKHLTAETKTEEFIAGKGVVVKWERIRRQNHWFDALYNACVAAHAMGVRLVQEQRPEPPPPPIPPQNTISPSQWFHGDEQREWSRWFRDNRRGRW